MLYIRKLIIEDEYGGVVHKQTSTKATDGLQEALEIVNDKDCKKSVKSIVSGFLKNMDKEFIEYFGIKNE